jgi:hypothetical protein
MNIIAYNFFHGHNIDNLVLVYRLLAGPKQADCVLSPQIHYALLEILPTTWMHLELIKSLLETISVNKPLQKNIVNSIFASRNSAWDIFQLTRKFDADGECIIYIYENITDIKKIDHFCKLFRGRDGAECVFEDDSFLYGKRPWLTKASFKHMVDYSDLAILLTAY